MRRLVLVFMLLLLPLQWSWAAAASVCGHENGKSHFGHHEHQHEGDEHAGGAPDLAPEPPGEHPDCHSCHGVGAACIERADAHPAAWLSSTLLPEYGRALPEPPIESLLRPPLTSFVA
ncbi:MAG: hypothetical protein ACOZJX_08375 [Pseudomonadota bacterium]